jgi:hypothetical protein
MSRASHALRLDDPPVEQSRDAYVARRSDDLAPALRAISIIVWQETSLPVYPVT